MRDYESFKDDLAMRESSDNYYCVNDFGYLGRYQFGKPRLYDLGYSIDGWHPKDQDVKNVISKEEFLTNRDLQDKMFYRHVQLICRYLRHKYQDAIKKHGESGLVAGVHLKGFGGLNEFLRGKDNSDALGTKISEYINMFSGYDLSNIR